RRTLQRTRPAQRTQQQRRRIAAGTSRKPEGLDAPPSCARIARAAGKQAKSLLAQAVYRRTRDILKEKPKRTADDVSSGGRMLASKPDWLSRAIRLYT